MVDPVCQRLSPSLLDESYSSSSSAVQEYPMIDQFTDVCVSREPDFLSRPVPPSLWTYPTNLFQCNVSLEGRYAGVDRNCFWNTLTTYLPHTPFTPPVDGPVKILDVACGDAMGAIPLVDYFEKKRSPEGAKMDVVYTGIDISGDALHHAAVMNWGRENFRFFEADARDFSGISDEQDLYDVILIRHPGPIKSDNGVDVWRDIAAEAFTHLSENGIIIVTMYYCPEYLLMRNIFGSELGAVEYVSGKNPYGRRYHRKLVRDNYIAIFGKRCGDS